jgi:putative transcriptional regulator
VKPIPAKQIRAIRAGLGFTQTQFASLLNVPKVTAISWENGTRKPSGAALRLLAVARKHPEALEAA